MDRQISHILDDYCSQNHSYSLFQNYDKLTQSEKEKYKEALEVEMATYMPFVKLEPGKYLIGTRERTLQIKGRNILVRTGGGYMHFEEYLRHYSRSECISLNKLVRKEGG